MSYCREALRRLSGDGHVMVAAETAPKQGTYRTGIRCRANGRRQDRDGRGGIPPQTEQRKRRLSGGTINERLLVKNFLQLPLFYNYRFSKKVRFFSGICINNGFRSRQPFANGHSYLPFSRLHILRIECHDIQSFWRRYTTHARCERIAK